MSKTVEQSKKFTWNDLVKEINKLPKQVREQQVSVVFEDESEFTRLDGLAKIPEDIYCDPDDEEDCGTLDQLRELNGEFFDIDKYELRTPEGTPFLWNNF